MVDPDCPLHVLIVAPGAHASRTVERALVRLGQERRAPHEIRIVGTSERVDEVHRTLLTPSGARRFAERCAAHGFSRDEILFNGRTLHPIDVVPGSSCSSTADQLLDFLRTFTASDAASLTVIAAEDAGAAAHLLHACLQVVARTTDRFLLDLSARASRGAKNGQAGHVEIPLLLWPANEPVPATYAEAVHRRHIERRRILSPDVLSLDRRRRTVSVGDTTFTLPSMQFFWLHYLALSAGERFPLAELSAHVASNAQRPFVQKLSDGRMRTFPADLQRAFIQMFPAAADKFDAMYQRACGVHPGLPSTISKINGALRRALGRGAGPYLIQGGRGSGGYRLTLPPSAIQIAGADVKRP